MLGRVLVPIMLDPNLYYLFSLVIYTALSARPRSNISAVNNEADTDWPIGAVFDEIRYEAHTCTYVT